MEKLNQFLERVKENFRKNRIVVSVLLLLWVITVVATLFMYKDSLGKASAGNEAFDNVVELVVGVEIQETAPIVEGSDAICIKMATYARKNTGTFNVRVVGTASRYVYADSNVNIANLQDNAFIVIELNEKLNRSKDRFIHIFMNSDCIEGNAAGVYYSNQKAFVDSTLKINEDVLRGDLSIRFLSDNDDLRLFYQIIITWVITTFTIIVLLILLVRPRYEILFTVIAVCFGLTFWLIITPMSVPDETIHYEYSFQLSNYIMGAEDHLIFDEEYQNYGAMAGHLNISAAYERFIRRINKPMVLKNRDVKMAFDIDESYKTCFIPQALGITLGRIANLNMLQTFYLGRLFNLAFYVVCVYIAIKKTPVHKLLFGVLATLPIFMQQAASFSYDCFINGLTFVIIAFMMKWIHEDKPIEKKDFIMAFIANLLIAPIKVVYGLFSLLYWFVPEKRFGSRKNKIIGILIITFPATFELIRLLAPLVFRVVRKIFEHMFVTAALAKALAQNDVISLDIIVPEQIPYFMEGDVYTFSYVTDHPVEMLMLFLRTVRYSLKTWFYASFGRALSGNTLILPTWIVHSILALLVGCSIREEKTTESIGFKIASIITCIFAGLMMVGGMLISWTEVEQVIIEDYGGPIIQGIQGRYFSALLPYLFIILHNNKIKISKKFDSYILYIFVLLVFEVVVYVLSYTFMN